MRGASTYMESHMTMFVNYVKMKQKIIIEL